jgi:hypothetical protein
LAGTLAADDRIAELLMLPADSPRRLLEAER